MPSKPSRSSFYTQVLARALTELESACTAPPDSQEFLFYRAEAPLVLEEAREALTAMKHYLRELEASVSSETPEATRH